MSDWFLDRVLSSLELKIRDSENSPRCWVCGFERLWGGVVVRIFCTSPLGVYWDNGDVDGIIGCWCWCDDPLLLPDTTIDTEDWLLVTSLQNGQNKTTEINLPPHETRSSSGWQIINLTYRFSKCEFRIGLCFGVCVRIPLLSLAQVCI